MSRYILNVTHTLILSGCILLLLISCTSNTESDFNQTILTGKILNYKSIAKTKSVRLEQYFGESVNEEMESAISKSGKFKFTFLQHTDQEFSLYPFNDIHVFLRPGDSLHLTIDLMGSEIVKYDGDGKLVSEQLHKFYSNGEFNKLGEDIGTVINMSPDQYRLEGKAILERNLERIETVGDNIDKVTKGLLTKNAHNTYLQNQLAYGVSGCSMLNADKSVEAKINDRYKFISLISEDIADDINNISAHGSYYRMLNYYAGYLIDILRTDGSIEPNLKDVTSRIEMINNLESNPDIIEGLLYNFTKRALQYESIDSLEKIMNRVMKNIKTDDLQKELEHMYSERITFNRRTEPLHHFTIATTGDSTGIMPVLNHIKSVSANKVIYVDLWAPWCQPCIEDMANSRSIIREDFANSGVDFYYLCSGEKDVCAKMILNKDFAGTHLILSTDQSKSIMSEFGLSGYPSQLIINKEGELMYKGHNYQLASSMTTAYLKELQTF